MEFILRQGWGPGSGGEGTREGLGGQEHLGVNGGEEEGEVTWRGGGALD